ncbi:MAG: HAD family hydrolase [Proteobacteria bacterium]|nr:HAD family hydrolase [Pseudomonadota bacterium]
MPALSAIAFDADDTLWHNERFFRLTHDHFTGLLADYAGRDHLEERLLAAERRNIGRYGYGIKGFTLSMIETALEVTENRVPGHVIGELVAAGREMLAHPIELLPHARETVEALKGRHRLFVITKGDLLDQERKVAQSGLGEIFDAVEIVSDKTAPVYAGIFRRLGVAPDAAMMVGNSLKSDVLPILALGGWGIHVPHDLTWALEHETAPEAEPRFRTINDLGALPGLIGAIEAEG